MESAEPISPYFVSGPSVKGLKYFCTTRQLSQLPQYETDAFNLGLNTPEESDRVLANRASLCELASLPAVPLWLRQVHGTEVFDADQQIIAPEQDRQADAIVTTRSDRVLAILTADCLPVVFWDGPATVVGAAHAGWRGLLDGVLENTWAELIRKRPDNKDWHAWIGPAISQPCFEVGQEVYDGFVARDGELKQFFKPGLFAHKWYADLNGIAEFLLRKISSGYIQVYQSRACTYTDSKRYYSYRRSSETGRQATIVYLTSASSV